MHPRSAAVAAVLVLSSTASLAFAAGYVAPPAAGPTSRADLFGARAGSTPQEAALPSPNQDPRSDPPAAAWQALGPFGGDVEAVAISPANADLMLAGLAPANGTGRLYRSTNAGASWAEVAALAGNSVYDISFAPNGAAYVGTTESIWKSTNGGLNWTHLNLGIGGNDVVLAVTLDPTNPNTIWAGVSEALGNQTQTVLRSTNGGTNWTNMTPPMSPMGCRGIAIQQSNPSKVYACFGGDFGGGAVWVTTNGGLNWFNRSAGLPANPMNDVIHDGSRVLLCGGMLFGSQTVGLYASTNDGASWTPIHDGSWPSLIIRDIDLDPNDPATIVLGSDGRGVFLSTNAGVSWSFGAGGTGSFSVRAARYAPGSSTRIALGLGSLGVYQSLDGGASFAWSSLGIGALNIYSIASNPASPNELAVAFQGQNDGGVYTSLDRGQTWILESCPATRYTTVRFTDAGILHAISSGPTNVAPEGVYRRLPDTGVWTCLGPDQGGLFESDLNALRFSHHDPDLILAGGADFGVAGFEGTCWISTDAGGTWTKSFEGPESSEMVFDMAIVEDGADLTVVAAFSDFGQSTGGALRSTDGGWTWNNSSAGLPVDARGTALDAFAGEAGTLYYADSNFGAGHGGLFKTTDAGASWASAGYAGQGSVGFVVCDAARPGVLYITRPDPEKVMVSVDGGTTFTAYNTGLNVVGSAQRLAYASGPERLLLATMTGSAVTSLADPAGLVAGSGGDLTIRAGAHPNPVTGARLVVIEVPMAAAGELTIHDPAGRLVRRLSLIRGAAQWNLLDGNAARVPPGVYFARLSGAGHGSEAAKIHVLR